MTALLDALDAHQGEQALESYAAVFDALRAEGFLGLGRMARDQLRYTETSTPCWPSGAHPTRLENGARRDVDTLSCSPPWTVIGISTP